MRLDARVLDGRRFTDAQLDALWAAIQVNDVIAPFEAPSITPRLDYDDDQLIDGFGISRRLWQRDYVRDELLGLVRTLSRDGQLDADERLRFKHVRAKFKHLRFAFVLYGADHRCPAVFKAVTTAMGHLQDAFKTDHVTAIRRYATTLRLLMNGLPHAMLQREVDRLKPCGRVGYRDYVLKQIATLRAMLEAPTMTSQRFHDARKIVSRQVSFHDDMRAIQDRAEHRTMSGFLGAINGVMGREHDLLVLGQATGDRQYSREHIILPADIRRRLTTLVELYPSVE